MHDLKRAGIKIAMDDFGTGYSSLSYLLKFPFDKIKIDRAFVVASGEGFAAREILRSILGLAQRLDIQVTSEGVETLDQARLLAEFGSTLLQGYHFDAHARKTGSPSGLQSRLQPPCRCGAATTRRPGR